MTFLSAKVRICEDGKRVTSSSVQNPLSLISLLNGLYSSSSKRLGCSTSYIESNLYALLHALFHAACSL